MPHQFSYPKRLKHSIQWLKNCYLFLFYNSCVQNVSVTKTKEKSLIYKTRISRANSRGVILTKLLKLFFFFTYLQIFPNLTKVTSVLKLLDRVVMVLNVSIQTPKDNSELIMVLHFSSQGSV